MAEVTTTSEDAPRMLYRFQEHLFSEARVMLSLSSFQVFKTTKAGAWIDVCGRQKFVLMRAHKRYACPTIGEALASYHARKDRQLRILRQQVCKAEAARTLQRDGESVYFGLEHSDYGP